MEIKRFKYTYVGPEGTVNSIIEAANPIQARTIIESRHPALRDPKQHASFNGPWEVK